MENASKKYDLEANLIDLNGPVGAQDSPYTFGSFCIILDGKFKATILSATGDSKIS